MSLKDHLEHLVMRLGSRASTPSHGGNKISITTTLAATGYVLPSDGYVSARLYCRTDEDSGLEIIAAEAPESAALAVLVQPSSDSDAFTTLFVYGKKGDTARLKFGIGADVIGFWFTPSVGGRY